MTDAVRVLIVSDDPGFGASAARALDRAGLHARSLPWARPPEADLDMALFDVRSPAALPAALRLLRARPGLYAAAVGGPLGREEIRSLYTNGLVRYLRGSASPERIAACLAGDADRAAQMRRRAERAELERRRPSWRRMVDRTVQAIVPPGPDRRSRLAAFAGLSVVAGLLLGAGLQTAAETTATVERLERRIEALQQETSAVRELRPVAPPASPPWPAPDRETRRPD
ncbi:MAG TPA: hypothetical protein VEJ18_07535 [Planctomycetota bacterium]|nr:hypothetical protein [Planctomycetota bacterium]